MFLTAFWVGGIGATLARNPPILAKLASRRARKAAFASSASSAVTVALRPWLSETKLEERSSVHFTGRPKARAACSTQTESISGKAGRLHAERAADIAGGDVNLLGLDVEHVRKIGPHAVDALRTDMQREAAILEHADGRTRLHGVDDDSAVDEAEPR